MKIVTASHMRKIEQIAIEEMGIHSILLMENAAISMVKHCLEFLLGKKNPKVLIVCGSGNNGGDGLALARHLYSKGIYTEILFPSDENAVHGDPAIYMEIIKNLKIPINLNTPSSDFIRSFDLVIDALIGTGLDRLVSGKYETIIELVNNYSKYVISVDIPSGVHSDNGKIMGVAVKANETVTFGYPKVGLYAFPGAEYAGIIHIEDISLPPNLDGDCKSFIFTEQEVAEALPVRKQRSNKGTYGKVLVFAGSDEMPGAAALASSAVYMAGGGLVYACVLHDVAKVLHNHQREIVTRVLQGKDGMYCKKSLEIIAEEINNYNAIILGPGIGRSGDVTEFVHEIISIAKIPLVLDADALFAVSEYTDILKQTKAPCVITPHPLEMSRLSVVDIESILENPLATALEFSAKFNVVTLLKDAHTIVTNKTIGSFYINTTGNNSLSKAGSGDVLTGMIAGFIAQGKDIFSASALAAFIHGKAGEAASEKLSNYGVTASDLLKYIPKVINNLL